MIDTLKDLQKSRALPKGVGSMPEFVDMEEVEVVEEVGLAKLNHKFGASGSTKVESKKDKNMEEYELIFNAGINRHIQRNEAPREIIHHVAKKASPFFQYPFYLNKPLL